MIKTIPNKKPFILRGRWRYRFRNLAWLTGSSISVSARRLVRGPSSPGCSWGAETGTAFLRSQFLYAFGQEHIADGREYLDSVIFHSPAIDQVAIEEVDEGIKGAWYTPPELVDDIPLLFFPGGGYVFLPVATATLHALIALATGRRLFALTYPLAPEYPFPAQLVTAQRAVNWLIQRQGIQPESLILGGASAGGNLCLALLLTLRDQGRAQPALAFLLSPWVDLTNSGASMVANEPMDWISKKTSDMASGWFCGLEQADHPLVSPLYADLQDLPPIYIQAGGSEIFVDMIRAFATRAANQGAQVQLEVWEKMIHCFQSFGDDMPEARAALDQLGQVVNFGLS